jgi:hypothetical protein
MLDSRDVNPLRPAAAMTRVAPVIVALMFLLAACDGRGESPARPTHIEGRYAFAGRIAATMEVKRDGERYAVALSGGSPRDAGAAAPADCAVRALGTVRDAALDAQFVGVETDTFAYSAARAKGEGRRLSIVFRPGGAEITRADTDGYCGLGATFVGPYQRIP